MNARADLPVGLVKDMPLEQYLAVDAVSASGLRVFARSPWHYRNRIEASPTPAMLRGTLAHCALLEPSALSERYVVVPEDAPKRPSKAQWAAKKPSPDSVLAMEWWTGFQKSCGTREIVANEDYAITQEQLRALQLDTELSGLFGRGYGEASVFWVDKTTNVYCKARPDWVRPTSGNRVILVDLKSTADDSPEGFARSAARLGYHRQRAHYVEGFQQATGLEVEDFVFAAVSSAPPVLAIPYRMVDEIVQQGEDECAELLAKYAMCLRLNDWPAYAPEQRMIDFPKWAKRSQEIEVSFA